MEVYGTEGFARAAPVARTLETFTDVATPPTIE